MASRCKFWLPKKNRFCSNAAFNDSSFCGNHTTRSHGQWVPCPIDPSHSVLRENCESHLRKCPLLKHAQSLSVQPFYQKRINGGKDEKDAEDFDGISSEMKRKAVYSLTLSELYKLISKIKSIHASLRGDIQDSHKIPDSCDIWVNQEVDRKLPFQEKHVLQQASILGNLEEFGVLKASRGRKNGEKSDCDGLSSIVQRLNLELGGVCSSLKHHLDKYCNLKSLGVFVGADRSLRQKENMTLERLRIDSKLSLFNLVLGYLEVGFAIMCALQGSGKFFYEKQRELKKLIFSVSDWKKEISTSTLRLIRDCGEVWSRKAQKRSALLLSGKAQYSLSSTLLADLCESEPDDLEVLGLTLGWGVEDLNLNAVEPLQGVPYLATGKHLCGPATDMTLRCCLAERCAQGSVDKCRTLKGLLAIATCCHRLCQWKHYINKRYMSDLGIAKQDFHAITWFTSWAVDADHGSDLSDVDSKTLTQIIEKEECGMDSDSCGVEETLRNMDAVERAVLGFMCKDIIDMGRLMWIKERRLESKLVKYVPSNISPENHLLIARLGVNL
ncbi:hypothetical protein RJ639_033623 [Escallonia herrerae]|uniref:tRNA:m(4)X modification enzyme TRM13 n=1 Tax=Escallonia herrerae TaxID=1293975 RepID=A0AA88WV05_9ASTE|nr:hypothetical protein RJ639_033623 [Escallonia herrerae]